MGPGSSMMQAMTQYPALGQVPIAHPYEPSQPGNEHNKYASLKAVGKSDMLKCAFMWILFSYIHHAHYWENYVWNSCDYFLLEFLVMWSWPEIFLLYWQAMFWILDGLILVWSWLKCFRGICTVTACFPNAWSHG